MKQLLDSQKAFFNSNLTKDTRFRIIQLKKLKKILIENEERLNNSIFIDFKKSAYETYIAELGLLYYEIDYAIKNLRKWSCTKRVNTKLVNFPAKSYIVPVPLGTALIIGSWNLPYSLSLAPAVAAIAAGNTVVLKPSEVSANTSHVMAKLINENFEPHFFKVIEGGIPETTELLNQKFDKIFFTGSAVVGKIVYQAAAKNLIPVTLELGGKNPAIFTEKCNLKMAVKRMIWGKFLNAGQTCIAPDYALVHKSIKDKFLDLAVAEIEKSQFSIENNNYVELIDKKNTKRLIDLIEKEKIHYGGNYDLDKRQIVPTILKDIDFDDKIMQKEIFGPILPVIEYEDLNEVIAQMQTMPKPLVCYTYTSDKEAKSNILSKVSFGCGAINDSIMHYTNNKLPFGGIGESGMGSYHGKYGFDTFTHYKSILEKPTWFESNLKYFPHTPGKFKLLKRLLK